MFPKDTNHSSREHVWSNSAPQEAESEMHPLLRETKQGGGGAVGSLSSHAGRCGESVVRLCELVFSTGSPASGNGRLTKLNRRSKKT